MEMLRYGTIVNKNKREIVLLKSFKCRWGKCAFCDYINDNSSDEEEIVKFNRGVLNNVTGEYKSLEVINSASVFELPEQTLSDIKHTVETKGLEKLYFESHWMYRNRLSEITDLYKVPVIFKCGVETFDDDFRNKVLNKGMYFDNPKEVAKYFKSICLMVGIKGQTREMISRDIDYLLAYFERGCINIFTDNTTDIHSDRSLIDWFRKEYSFLESKENIEILWDNTDFGVGSLIDDE